MTGLYHSWAEEEEEEENNSKNQEGKVEQEIQ